MHSNTMRTSLLLGRRGAVLSGLLLGLPLLQERLRDEDIILRRDAPEQILKLANATQSRY